MAHASSANVTFSIKKNREKEDSQLGIFQIVLAKRILNLTWPKAISYVMWIGALS